MSLTHVQVLCLLLAQYRVVLIYLRCLCRVKGCVLVAQNCARKSSKKCSAETVSLF